MEYSAVIFDLDGTLLDTLADIADAANRVLVSRQLPTHDVPAYRHFVGDGVEALMQRAMPAEHRDAEIIASSSAQFRRVYCETWNLSTCPYPGIRELLDLLAQRQVQMAFCPTNPRRTPSRVLTSFLMPRHLRSCSVNAMAFRASLIQPSH